MVQTAIFVNPQGALMTWTSMQDLQNSHVALSLIVGFGMLVQLLLLYIYFNRSGFADNGGGMVIIWFFILIAAGGYASKMSPIWLVNIIIAAVFLLNTNYTSDNMKGKDLFSGVLIAVASLFYPIALLLCLFVISSLIINRFSKIKDILLLLIGILLVYIYFFCYYFFTDQLPLLFAMLSQWQFVTIFTSLSGVAWQEIVLIIVASIGILYAGACLKSHYDNKLIVYRKRLINIHLLTFTGILMMLFSPYPIHDAIAYLIVPISLYYAMLSQLKSHRIANDIIMVLFIIALCL